MKRRIHTGLKTLDCKGLDIHDVRVSMRTLFELWGSPVRIGEIRFRVLSTDVVAVEQGQEFK